MTNLYYQIKQLSPRKTRVLLYHYYPEVGPKGTPGRGPYCIKWIPILKKQISQVHQQAKKDGVLLLPNDA